MMRARVILGAALTALGACGAARPTTPWLEEELGQTHDSAPRGSQDAAAALPGEDAAIADVRVALDAVDRGGELGALRAALVAAPPAALPALEALAAATVDGVGRAALFVHLGRVWLHGGAHERAAPHLARARAALQAVQPKRREALERELAALEAAPAPRAPPRARHVAVLLPQTGRFAALGRELARVLDMAPPGLTFRRYDTAGDAEQAAAMVDRAVAEGALAILGPVGEREARAAARRAVMRGVPIALLAPQDGAAGEAGVFRATYSVQDEARAAAEWAAANFHQSVAVFAPRDDLGALAAAAFGERARELGLRLVASEQYDAAGGDVEGDVKKLLGLVPAQNPRLAAHLRRGGKRAWQTFVPELDLSLLYLPDRGERAALIAAYLPYFGVELRTHEIMDPVRLARKYRGARPAIVQLLGGAGWASPTLPVRGGAAVQGAMVLDVCAAQRDDVAEEAHAQLAAALGAPPSAAAAQLADITRWMTDALAQLPAGDHDAARRALARTSLPFGACGPLSVDARGEVAREPAVLQIEGEELVLVP